METHFMLSFLSALNGIIEPGISLTKTEVIKRYRSIKNFNQKLLQLLQMTQFSMLTKSEKGEIYVV
jgi:hypothetical protein